LYGLDDPNPIKAGFGRNCLLARRLIERDVRFVTLFNGAFAMGEGALNWDGHRRIKSDYDRHGPILDGPCAALLTDLKARGLLDDTLVLWTSEFGRMPTFQKGAEGRDHNPKGFTAWMAGAGVKRGFSFGATDDFGHQAVENVVDVHDFHATVLHLLGLDHERLTFYHNGTQRRLTDVHGHVIADVLTHPSSLTASV
jgi:arylsulfatase A-like enzyme